MREIFTCGIQNPGLWNLEYSSRNPESHQRLDFIIQALTKTGIQYMESGMYSLESRIQFILHVKSLISMTQFAFARLHEDQYNEKGLICSVHLNPWTEWIMEWKEYDVNCENRKLKFA